MSSEVNYIILKINKKYLKSKSNSYMEFSIVFHKYGLLIGILIFFNIHLVQQ